jgi:hypothetical protein
MKVLADNADGATIQFSAEELRLIFGVLIELRDGANAIDDEDWEVVIGQPRELELEIIDGLQKVLRAINDSQT